MIHVEGCILGDSLSFNVKNTERCHQIRKALKFFDIKINKSSCSEGCNGCPVPSNFQINELPKQGD